MSEQMENEQEAHDEVQTSPDYSEKFNVLETQIEELRMTNNELLEHIRSFSAQKEQKPQAELSPEQVQRLSADPANLARFISDSTEKATSKVRSEIEKERWDEKAFSNYPMLQNDQKFRQEVKRQMQELISGREYTKDSPKLLFRAAQLAGAKFGDGNVNKTTHSSSKETSMAPSSAKIVSSSSSKSKISDDDPRIRFHMMMKPNVTKEELERFKGSLSPDYQRTTQRKRQL